MESIGNMGVNMFFSYFPVMFSPLSKIECSIKLNIHDFIADKSRPSNKPRQEGERRGPLREGNRDVPPRREKFERGDRTDRPQTSEFR